MAEGRAVKWMDKPIDHTRDPRPYDGPIERADGRRSFNMHFWPMAGDSWWAYDEFGHRGFSGRFHFEVIGLADGRWSTYGSVYSIESNEDCYGRSCVFDTREKAIRIAAARFIRLCRRSRKWDYPDHLTEENCRRAINWALGIARRPAIEFAPIVPPTPKLVVTGMPLFDHGVAE
jgi:hypothetical protein